MKLIRRISLIVLVAIIIAFAAHLYERLSFASPEKFFALKDSGKDTTLTIGIIGDSWVSYHKLDTILKNALAEKNINAGIISSGKDGARTKQIYQSIFNSDSTGFSSKSIVEQQPDICIVIAGVNDAQSFTGSDNYAHHMVLITKTLLHYKIKPLIVSLPLFNTEKAQKNIGVHRVIRNKTAALITGETTGNIPLYRKALKQLLHQEKLSDSIVMVDFENFCVDLKFCNELYRDALHLNEEGNRKLCELIVKEIVFFEPQRH